MFLHHKLKACHYLEDWNPQLATFFFLAWSTCLRWLQTKDEPFFFVSGTSLSLSETLFQSLPPPPWTISLYMYKISLFRFICCSGFMGFNFFRKLRCSIRCQFNCQHCKQVSGLSLVYLHLHHFLHRLQDSSTVFGAILHHAWSLCNHFEANDIVGVLAGSPVCFLIFSSPDLRNDMPHLLFAEVDIYCSL